MPEPKPTPESGLTILKDAKGQEYYIVHPGNTIFPNPSGKGCLTHFRNPMEPDLTKPIEVITDYLHGFLTFTIGDDDENGRPQPSQIVNGKYNANLVNEAYRRLFEAAPELLKFAQLCHTQFGAGIEIESTDVYPFPENVVTHLAKLLAKIEGKEQQ